MDASKVSRAIRKHVWPSLAAQGFDDFTDRAAWRRGPAGVDVVDVLSVGANADAVGCTSFSFSACVASFPSFLPPGNWTKLAGPQGQPRLHYWHCPLRLHLKKSLAQPWFAPRAVPDAANLPAGILQHHEGLLQVIRRDTHDRPEIWFVRDDGSNFDEVIADLRKAIELSGLPVLDRFHSPSDVLERLK